MVEHEWYIWTKRGYNHQTWMWWRETPEMIGGMRQSPAKLRIQIDLGDRNGKGSQKGMLLAKAIEYARHDPSWQ